MVTDAELQQFRSDSDRRHAENREAIAEVKDDLHREISEGEKRLVAAIADLKTTLANTAADLKKTTAEVAENIRAENDTYRAEHQKAADQRWVDHTGEGGDHEQLSDQRKEDINRMYTWLGIGAVIFAAAMGIASTRLVWLPSSVLMPASSLLGLILLAKGIGPWLVAMWRGG